MRKNTRKVLSSLLLVPIGILSSCKNTVDMDNIVFNEKNVVLIGKNTTQALTNGIYYLTLEGILGICKRVEAELGYHCKKVLTGGISTHFKDELHFSLNISAIESTIEVSLT